MTKTVMMIFHRGDLLGTGEEEMYEREEMETIRSLAKKAGEVKRMKRGKEKTVTKTVTKMKRRKRTVGMVTQIQLMLDGSLISVTAYDSTT